MKIPVVIESLKSLEETKDGATVVAKLTSVLMQARKRSVSHLVEAQQMADNLAIIAGGKADVMLARQQANADQSSDTNNSICWFSLLAKRLPVALTHGQAAVAANGENRTAWGNLAHAKLLLGQEREAMAIYRKFKGQDLRPGISWLQATADDLALLAELGYPRDPMNRVLADLGLPRLVGWP
jgi:hypothetical protein